MGVQHTFIRGAKAPRIPLEAADQRSGAREAGRRIHRCWPASRGCQPAACGRHRLWNVAIGSVDASISHGAHLGRSLVDPTIEADLLADGGVGLDVVDCLGVFLGVCDVLRVFSVCM